MRLVWSLLLAMLLQYHHANAQSNAPVTSAFTVFSKTLSAQLNSFTNDTTVTFAQMEPYLAAAFAVYQKKKRLERAEKPQTKYLFVVTLDGMRWQDVFNGADSLLLHNREYVHDTAAYRNLYWDTTPALRRQRLMPFLWSTIASKGQIHGNRKYDNNVNVANGMWFSYPGYNEIFTGQPDDEHIKSNLKIANPNENVLEFLNKQKGFRNKVVAFGSWDAFPAILNEKRSNMLVNSGFENRTEGSVSRAQVLLNKMQHEQPKPWKEDERFDVFTWAFADEYIRAHHPRVCYIGFGDTDEFAHEGHYDLYLDAAHQADLWLAELWQYLQSDAKYQGKTTLLITTDHGRGDKIKKQWRDHNARIEGADQIWCAAMGPDTPAHGELKTPGQLYQKQMAQTMANLLGFTFAPQRHTPAPAAAIILGK